MDQQSVDLAEMPQESQDRGAHHWYGEGGEPEAAEDARPDGLDDDNEDPAGE
jgi:hypothetical protein